MQATCDNANLRQEEFYVYLDHTLLFPFHGCARGNQRFLTAVRGIFLFRLMQVDEWTVCRRLSFGKVCWMSCPVDQPRGGREHQRRERGSRLLMEKILPIVDFRRLEGQRSRSPALRDNSAESQLAKKTGESPSGKEDRLPCFIYKRGFFLLTESVIIGAHCTYFKKHCQIGKGFPLVRSQKQGRSTSPRRKEKSK